MPGSMVLLDPFGSIGSYTQSMGTSIIFWVKNGPSGRKFVLKNVRCCGTPLDASTTMQRFTGNDKITRVPATGVGWTPEEKLTQERLNGPSVTRFLPVHR